MAALVKIVGKDFNPDRLREDLEGAGFAGLLTGQGWAGFARISRRRYTPNAGPRIVGRTVINGAVSEDTAQPGELRFQSSRDLTPAEDAALDAALAAHDANMLSAEQVREDQDETDLTALLQTDRATYIAHLQNWSGYGNAQKFAAAEDMFRIVGKILRLLLRRERGATI